MRLTAISLALLSIALPGMAHGESHFSAMLPPASKSRALAEASVPFALPAHEIVLGALPAEQVAPLREAGTRSEAGPRQVGLVRELPSIAGAAQWRAVQGGSAVRFSVRAEGARALRVRIEARRSAAGVRARFWSPAHPETIHAEALDAGGSYWSPLVEGDTAVVEVFAAAPVEPLQLEIALTRVAEHFDSLAPQPAIVAKWAALPCQADLICESRNDALLARAGAASLKISWIDDDGHAAYACSATLLNPADGSFRPYIYTAAHCIDDEASARNVVSQWFYETSTCGGEEIRPEAVVTGGGATLLASDRALDASFLRLNRMPPAGVTYAGWNSEPPVQGEPVTALHHANGEGTKISHATVMPPPPYDFLAVAWNSGIVQGGSSGSGLFSRIDSPRPDLLFRGGLAGANSSCASPGFALYSRIDKVWPKIAPYLSTSVASANATGLWFDAGEPGWGMSVSQQGDTLFGVLFIHGQDGRPAWLVAPAMRAGEVGAFSGPVFRTTGRPLQAAGSWAAAMETAGSLDFRLSGVGEAELSLALDGRQLTTRRLSKQVFGSNPPICVTSPQASRASAANYQDLWWDPEQPGWGLGLAHQDDLLFATLFTYDESGAATWYAGPSVARQPDGRFKGALFRTSGAPATAGWAATAAVAAGQLELTFSDGESALAVFDLPGVKASRRIVRQVFAGETTVCH